jgi:tRNA modification GTPase
MNQYANKITLVINKIDLTGEKEGERDETVFLSAKTGEGLAALTGHLKRLVAGQGEEGALFVARKRHVIALERTYAYVKEAYHQALNRSGELVAEELKRGREALGEIVGHFTTEDLLGDIFSHFCIGK